MTAFDFSPSRLPIRRSALVAGVAALAAVIAVPSLLDNRTGHQVSASTTADAVDRSAPAATTSVVPPAATPATPVAAIAIATATPATASVTSTAPAELAKPPAPPAATAACHNSTDPSCGAFSWSPAPAANQPMSIAVAVSPAMPKAGELVTVTVTATDPDALVTTNGGSYFFADPNSTEPQVGFAATFDSGTPRYGQWTPPAAQPGHLELSLTHTFSQAGTFDFTFAALSGDESAPGDVQRNPYASSASTKVPITVAPAAA